MCYCYEYMQELHCAVVVCMHLLVCALYEQNIDAIKQFCSSLGKYFFSNEFVTVCLKAMGNLAILSFVYGVLLWLAT